MSFVGVESTAVEVGGGRGGRRHSCSKRYVAIRTVPLSAERKPSISHALHFVGEEAY